MPIYKLKLLQCKEVAKNTFVFDFEKPDGFNFIPGQYGGFTLINPTETDANGITRRFSLLSTPEENIISLVTRMQGSAFKRVLLQLPLGSEIKFAGPIGNFTLHEDIETPAVLIAGGIGIAPFYSMIKHHTKKHSHQKIFLFYGNQTRDDAAFLSELIQLEKNDPDFKFIPTLAMPDENWQGESGYITYTMIKKHILDLNKPIYYICGSPAMVNVLHETLNEMDIPEERIRIEDFPGY